jgi:transposase
MTQDTYPTTPGFKEHGGASEEAAERIKESAATLRRRALDVLKATPAGLTADEIASRLNVSILSIRPRISELGKSGSARKSGARRRNRSGMSAAVWLAS